MNWELGNELHDSSQGAGITWRQPPIECDICECERCNSHNMVEATALQSTRTLLVQAVGRPAPGRLLPQKKDLVRL
jgi:hypothetical protein